MQIRKNQRNGSKLLDPRYPGKDVMITMKLWSVRLSFSDAQSRSGFPSDTLSDLQV